MRDLPSWQSVLTVSSSMKKFELILNRMGAERYYILAYLLVANVVAIAVLLPRVREWSSGTELHALMDVSAAVLAFIVGLMALLGFYSKRIYPFLFIGIGFLGAGIFDLTHVMLTSDALRTLAIAEAIKLPPLCCDISQQFLSIFLFGSWLAWFYEQEHRRIHYALSKSFFLLAGGLATLIMAFVLGWQLASVYFPYNYLLHPKELYSALLFFTALVGYLHKNKWRQNIFEHWLVLSLIISFFGQVALITHAGTNMELEIGVAHVLKIASYICVLTGLLTRIFAILQREEERACAASEAKREAEDLLVKLSAHQFALDTHGMVAVADTDGTLTYVNNKYCWISKYSREELIGQNHAMLISDHHPEDFFDKIYKILESGKVWHGELKGRAKDGSHFWLDSTFTPVTDSNDEVSQYITIHSDISKNKRTELSLKSSLGMLEVVFNNFPGGISVFSKDLILNAANPAFYRLLDLPEERFPVGARYEDIIRYNAERGEYGEGAVEDLVAERVSLAKKFERHAFKRVRPGGTSLEVKGWPLSEGGFITTYMDVTEVEDMVAEISLKNERFNAALRNMSEGLCMFDSDQNLIVGNPVFIDMFGLSAKQVKPGVPLRKILSYQVASGNYAGADPKRYKQEFLDWVRRDRSGNKLLDLNDGRKIEVRLDSMAGSGCLLTYSDETQRIRAEMDLRTSNSMLEERVEELEQLKTALEEKTREAISIAADLHQAKHIQMDAIHNISEGFALWNSDDKLIMCNTMFKSIFHCMEDVIQPGIRYEDFVRQAYKCKIYVDPGDKLEELVFDRVMRRRGSVVPFDERLADGRWIRTSERAASEGRIVGIITDISEQKRSEQAIKQMAQCDGLTGLLNRNMFLRRLEQALENANRTEHKIGVMLLDLDHFKNINDTMGHPVGDALLCQVSKRLQESIRKTDTVSRLGGDEFAVMASNVADISGIDIFARKINAALNAPYHLDGQVVHSGASIGIAIYPNDGANAEELLRNADIALYKAKDAGRRRYRLFDSKMDEEAVARMALEREMQRALDEEQFALYYQPQVDISSGRIIGAEALLRWPHPERGMISPAEFVPVAESTRLILPLGEWVVKTACQQISAWQDRGLPPIVIAINKSPLQFKHQDLLGIIESALKTSKVGPELLELEITESVAMENSSIELFDKLRDVGVKMAIDDFGTGYSSLSRLMNFPMDRLKIDKSFVKSIESKAENRAICTAIIKLGKSLGLRILAEGVETIHELETLRDLGCDEIQGFLCAPALPPKAFEDLVRHHVPLSGTRRDLTSLPAKRLHSA